MAKRRSQKPDTTSDESSQERSGVPSDTPKTAANAASEKAGKRVVRKPARPVCFTIMPFGGWFDDYYEALFRPAIETAGLEPKRADDLYRPSTIVNDIWSYTQSARVILADLTGKNPNVFYELGLAHALAKPAILVTESINDVPFDLRALRVLEYDKNQPNWGDGLRERITKAIREVVESPLESVLPAFLSVKPSAKPKEVTQRDKAILELRSDLDILRQELRRGRHGEPELLRSELDARAMLEHYSELGMPLRMIEERMVRAGAPPGWVREQLKRTTPAVAKRRRPPKAK
jgi:hypothetical protein